MIRVGFRIGSRTILTGWEALFVWFRPYEWSGNAGDSGGEKTGGCAVSNSMKGRRGRVGPDSSGNRTKEVLGAGGSCRWRKLNPMDVSEVR